MKSFVLMAAALLASSAHAAPFDGWTFNGNAHLIEDGATLRLAEANYQAGSAWAPTAVSVAHDFSVAFSFRIAGGTGADGLTFTVQNSAAGALALGGNGGGLGYDGIGNSAAFIFDTWENGWDTDRAPGPNTATAIGGQLNNWGGNSIGHAYDLRDKVIYSWVDYSAANQSLMLFISDTAVKPVDAQEALWVNLPSLVGGNTAYLGFTGGTGGASDNHDILSVQISAVPEAGAPWLLLAGAPLVLAARARRSRR
ncbi:MAG: L-type lectin-domain containing protein [Aquabacterium sp.]